MIRSFCTTCKSYCIHDRTNPWTGICENLYGRKLYEAGAKLGLILNLPKFYTLHTPTPSTLNPSPTPSVFNPNPTPSILNPKLFHPPPSTLNASCTRLAPSLASTPNLKPYTLNPKPRTPTPNPQPPNPEPQTPNPKPHTPNLFGRRASRVDARGAPEELPARLAQAGSKPYIHIYVDRYIYM